MIDMMALRHGYFPRAFVWRGRRYEVYGVERCWSAARRGLRGKRRRTYFSVRARSGHGGADQAFEIYQDVGNGSWHMERRVA